MKGEPLMGEMVLHGGDVGGGGGGGVHRCMAQLQRWKAEAGGMEIDTDSGLARSALTMWRRRTLHPDHIHTGEKKRGRRHDTYAG